MLIWTGVRESGGRGSRSVVQGGPVGPALPGLPPGIPRSRRAPPALGGVLWAIRQTHGAFCPQNRALTVTALMTVPCETRSGSPSPQWPGPGRAGTVGSLGLCTDHSQPGPESWKLPWHGPCPPAQLPPPPPPPLLAPRAPPHILGPATARASHLRPVPRAPRRSDRQPCHQVKVGLSPAPPAVVLREIPLVFSQAPETPETSCSPRFIHPDCLRSVILSPRGTAVTIPPRLPALS